MNDASDEHIGDVFTVINHTEYMLNNKTLAWCSGSVMDCHVTARVRFPVGTVYLPSFTSFARNSKWGRRL